jgi:hypothetical protein
VPDDRRLLRAQLVQDSYRIGGETGHLVGLDVTRFVRVAVASLVRNDQPEACLGERRYLPGPHPAGVREAVQQQDCFSFFRPVEFDV